MFGAPPSWILVGDATSVDRLRLAGVVGCGFDPPIPPDALPQVSFATAQSLTDETAREIVRYEYDLAGRMSRKTLGNGFYTTYGYDGAGHLLTLTNARPDAGEIISGIF